MPASLFGERFVAMREPAWHALGVVIPEGQEVTAEGAVQLGGIDYDYVKAPIGYTLPGGEFVPRGDKVQVLRAPTDDDPVYRPLGIVGQGYQFLQNLELARGLDAIASRTGWRFETVGALGDGGTVFMTLDAGTETVYGDDYRQYFLVSDGKASGRALRVQVVPTRVVCQNTLMAAEQAATLDVKIGHHSRVARDFKFWLDMVGHLEEGRQRVFDALRGMASVRITDEQARAVFEAAYPMPEKNARLRAAEGLADLEGLDEAVTAEAAERLADGLYAYEYFVAKAVASREASMVLYERINSGDEQGGRTTKKVRDKIARTPYAALQAVAELADWGGTARGAEAQAIFGGRAKAKGRAWAAASALAQ